MIDNIGIVAFNLSYIGMLLLVLTYLTRRTSIREDFAPRWIYLAFVALVMGDIVHILSRVIVYFIGVGSGNLEAIYAQDWAILLMGIGLGSTSITIHLFYLFIYIYWRKCEVIRWTASHDEGKEDTPDYIRSLDINAIAMTITRIILVFFPQNQWGVASSEPNVVRYITNLPLYVMGVQTIVVLFKQSMTEGVDVIQGFSPRERKMARNISYWMMFSYVMYSFTVFLTWVSPLFGMAMIPKTLAYLVMFYAFVKGYFMKVKPGIPLEKARMDEQVIPKPLLEST